MGQGYSLTTLSAASASIDVPELADLVHEKTLASARFMKSIRARNQQGFVFVKAVMKPYSSFDVSKYIKQISAERQALADIPNALGYQRIIEVGSGGFLVRQYINNSVYDRLSTRPFLEEIEKKWLAFQLLCAVRDCHARNIFHGDIKTENLLVTSWNWLFLTDFSASFKPTNLPEDNPADFSFYFDTSGRRTCYLAPERFTVGGVSESQGQINWAMDIFSVGCVIAEIFLEGPIFSLSQIFKYRAGEYSPEHTHLNKIEDLEVRDMILNMIELDPEKRYSAEQYLSFYRLKIFPDYFYSFLHQYMLDLTDPSAGRRPVTLELGNLGESDDKIDRVYYDFDKISYFLGYGKTSDVASKAKRPANTPRGQSVMKRSIRIDADSSLYDGTLLFANLILSSIRNTAKATARFKGCELLVLCAERLPDEAKLDRILPYITVLLNDRSDTVKVAALRSLTAILDMVQVVSPINAYIFPEYIFPRLKDFILSPTSMPNPLVRAAYASCLASLALSSARILDMVQAIRADGRLPALAENEWAPETSYHGLYDNSRSELVPHFEEATKALITDPDASVRRAFLGSVSRLCVFFGSSKANDVILSHLNTYLNDKDWILKCTFYEALVGVAAYVGSASIERFVLPVMIQSLTDSESFVIEKVFRSLARMAALGLLAKSVTWELLSIAGRYLIHPSPWIRESAVQFIALSNRYVSPADKYCIVLPIIQPFLKSTITEVTEETILDALKSPLNKSVFEVALDWATRAEKSAFWDAASHDSVFVLTDPEAPMNPTLVIRRLLMNVPPSQRGKEDVQPLQRLRTLGMASEDEMKLLALREYILRVARRKSDVVLDEAQQMVGNIISLNEIKVTPQTVVFDKREPVREARPRAETRQRSTTNGEHHTLTDALLDASTSIENQTSGLQSQRQPGNPNGSSPSDSEAADKLPRSGATRNSSKTSLIAERETPAININPSGNFSARASFSPGHEFPSSDPDKLSLRRHTSLGLKHRGSAINLMSRNDPLKADAETSTTSENAFGKVDGPIHARKSTIPSPLAMAAEAVEKTRAPSPLFQSTLLRYEPNHDYTGTDPNVLKLLDNHYTENFPVDLFDFGQLKHEIDPKAPIRRPSDVTAPAGDTEKSYSVSYRTEPWSPTGQLLTQFAEHSAAVNRVLPAPDHAFFVTASDDGTCKIWDSTRLEKNITPRSRQTYRHAPGTMVKCLCFVENTHTFISAADDGSIHVVRVDYKTIDGGDSTRYGKPTLVRDYQIKPQSSETRRPEKQETPIDVSKQEHAVWLYHYRTGNSQSILLATTNMCRILAIDLKTMDVIYTMSNPIRHGTPTTFCVDKRHHWLLLATANGICDLWDLRFRLRLKSFGIGTSASIDRMLVHPNKGHGKWVFISSGGEISVWDIEKMTCREVYRPSSYVGVETLTATSYEAWFPDGESSEKLVERFAERVKKDEAIAEAQSSPDGLSTLSPAKSVAKRGTTIPNPPMSIPGLYLMTDHIQNSSNTTEPVKTAMLFSGGADRVLRCWDITRPEMSRIVSSPFLNFEEGRSIVPDDKLAKVNYVVEHPLSISAGGQIAVINEVVQQPTTATQVEQRGSTKSTPVPSPASKRSRAGEGRGGGAGTPSSTTSGSGKDKDKASSGAGTSKPPRNTIISASQQRLLRTHMEGIMDVCVLKRPYGCVVSVDRGGCVFVFQ